MLERGDMSAIEIALIGDRVADKTAHQGIEASLELFRKEVPELSYRWVGTDRLAVQSPDDCLGTAAGVWCTPGSPYRSLGGALRGIRYAREEHLVFFGSCAGFQHALMEFARNVLGVAAEHAELNPGAPNPLIAQLPESLIGGKKRKLHAPADSWLAGVMGEEEIEEEFNCSYGLPAGNEALFEGSELQFIARDESGVARAFRMMNRLFYVGLLSQPERLALHGKLHPLLRKFFETCVEIAKSG